MTINKILLLVCGFLALGFGVVGIFLPIIPTTPFVLVAAVCFSNSNGSLYSKLHKSKYFGEFIENYRHKKGVSKKVKRISIAFLWCTLLISALITRVTMIFIILLIVGIAVTTHIVMIKQKK